MAGLATLTALLLCGWPGAFAFEPVALLQGFATRDVLVISANRCSRFEVRIARTRDQRAQGLMHIRHMADHEGMVFLFPSASVLSMWMKNTYIPLDMLFVDDAGQIAHIQENAEPHNTAIISSRVPVVKVIEITGGSVARLGIAVGDAIRLPAG